MLTRKQLELLKFIDQHLRTTGFSPSFEEMKAALNLRSKSGIHRLILALEDRGFLRRRAHRARALEVIQVPEAMMPRSMALAGESPTVDHIGEAFSGDEAPAYGAAGFSPNVIRGDFSARLPGVRAANEAGSVNLPLYGRIAAGLPIEALRDQGAEVAVPLDLLGNGEHYALEVSGDSMIEAGILNEDTVIIRKGDTAENGQIVVALVDQNEVTLKRLRRRGASIALEPANPRHETRIFPAERVQVQGRLVALLRRY